MLTLAVALTLAASQPALPEQGVLVPGRTLGGIALGETAAEVQAKWGRRYSRCLVCRGTTWLYTYAGGGPRGAAVTFANGRVSAVFTLGVPRGWRTTRGVRLGDPAEKVQSVYGRLAWNRCIGYGALSMRGKGAVSSIYTYGESVYGFALTRAGDPVCQ